MAYSVTFKPEPLGKIAPTAGTPLSLAANLTSGGADPGGITLDEVNAEIERRKKAK